MKGRVGVIALLALALAGGACATGPRSDPPPVKVRLATAEERTLVVRVLAPLLAALDYALDGADDELRLRDGCLISFGILISDRLNAAVGPGRTTPCVSFQLFVSEAALKTLPERTLQALLAHELGHVHLGHFAQAASRQRLQETWDSTLTGTTPETVDLVAVSDSGGVTTVSPVAALRALRREDEAEADQFAAALLRRVGGDQGREFCLALVDLFARLGARNQPRSAEWLATHPSPARRADAIRADCGVGSLALPRQR